jgi:hypothetical protein
MAKELGQPLIQGALGDELRRRQEEAGADY